MIGARVSQPRPRRRWIWIIVAIITTLVLVLPVGLRFWLKADMQRQSDPAVRYRRPITTLQVNAPGDSVFVRPGAAGRVMVASSLTWVLGRPVVSKTWRGKTLQVSVRCTRPDLFEDCAASLGLTVPAGVSVWAHVGSGTVNVSGLDGPLHLATTSGTITLGRVSGPVWVSASSGTIEGRRGLGALRLTASVGSGAVRLTFRAAPALLSLAVGTGSAAVTVPPGHYRVRRQNGPGVLTIAPGLSDPYATRLIRVSVGTGTLSVNDLGSAAR
jgi:hypothetical protein